MGHTVGKQAKRAVENSARADSMKMTPEQLIHALRNNVRANLFVPMYQIEALLADYDHKRVHIALLLTTNGDILRSLGAALEENKDLKEKLNRYTQPCVGTGMETFASDINRLNDDGGPVPPEE